MKTMQVPNQVTINAMREVEYMENNPSEGKTYSSFSALLEDVKED